MFLNRLLRSTTCSCAFIFLMACKKSPMLTNIQSAPAPTDADIAATMELGHTYPYEREPDSYLFINGKPVPYIKLGTDPLQNGTLLVDGKAEPVGAYLEKVSRETNHPMPAPFAKRTAVLGYGSNPTVGALQRKFMSAKFARGWAIFPVIRARMKDFEVVYAAHVAATNGSFPATMQYSQGAESDVWITYLDDEEMTRMHASEGIDATSAQSWYSYGRLDNTTVQVEGWNPLTTVFLYVDNYGALKVKGQTAALTKVPAQTNSPHMTQDEVLAAMATELGSSMDSETAKERCTKHTGIDQFLCESIVDPCVRDDRTETLQTRGHAVFWSLPETSGLTYTVLAGTNRAGHPDAFPQSNRCARPPRSFDRK